MEFFTNILLRASAGGLSAGAFAEDLPPGFFQRSFAMGILCLFGGLSEIAALTAGAGRGWFVYGGAERLPRRG